MGCYTEQVSRHWLNPSGAAHRPLAVCAANLAREDTRVSVFFRRVFFLLGVSGIMFSVLLYNAAANAPDTVRGIENGWLVLREANRPFLEAGAGPPVLVMIDGQPFPDDGMPDPVVINMPDGTVEVRWRNGTGLLTDRWRPWPELRFPGAWFRELEYTNRSGKRQDLTGAEMWLAPVRAENAALWNPAAFWMSAVTDTRALCLGYLAEADLCRIENRAGKVGHHVEAAWRLEAGERAEIGRQTLWLGDARAFRKEVRDWYAAAKIEAAPAPAWLDSAILYEYNAGGHIDSRFSDTGGFEYLARQTDYLADLGVSAVWLQAVHAHKTPPDPLAGGWNLYDPRDFFTVDTILGGEAALRELCDGLRDRGMRALGGIVPHGGHSVQGQAMEKWQTREQDGPLRKNWGGCGMDYASPEWQAVMGESMGWLAREFGFEGCRIDVAEGMGANWGSPRTNHASYSTLGGMLEMMRAIDTGLRTACDEPVLIPEAFFRPEALRRSPVVYGHETWMLFAREITEMIEEPAAMAEKLREFFETERGSMPPGTRVIRTLNNHDTVAESGRVHLRYGVGLSRALYGVCLMVPGIPMLYQEEEIGSVFALRRMHRARRGIPEFQSGTADYLAVTMAPEVFTCLREGEDGHALGLSNLSGNTIAGHITLPAEVDVEDGEYVYDAVSGRQAVIRNHDFHWRLAPYATALIRLGSPPPGATEMTQYHTPPVPVGTAAPDHAVVPMEEKVLIRAGWISGAFDPAADVWTREKKAGNTARYGSDTGFLEITKEDDNTWQVTLELEKTDASTVPELLLRNTAQWYVSGRTALLRDYTLRRHYPFPAGREYAWNRDICWGAACQGMYYDQCAPTGRLWQSLQEPLHPESPGAAFQDRDGSVLIVDQLLSDAGHIVLTDRSDEPCMREGHAPYALALRFYPADPDIAPPVRFGGVQPAWRLEKYPPPDYGPMRVSFRLTIADATDHPRLAALCEAERRPVRRNSPRITLEGGHTIRNNGAWWFPQTGTVTWKDMPCVDGVYRIRFELRHSESGPDGTDLDDAYTLLIDGRETPFEWTQRNTRRHGNAYFGHVLTPPLDLAEHARAITLRAAKPWTAVGHAIMLVEAASGVRRHDAAF
jgi:hypothetical protein